MPYRPPVFRPANGLGSLADTEQANRDYEQRRGSARDRGYDARWDRERLRFIARHPLCRGCESRGEVTRTAIVDHVIPHKGDMVLFWDEQNWQPSCQWDHDVLKQKLEGLWLKGEIDVSELRLDSTTARRLGPPLRCT
jgi:5-methylcytosine-specific restriction endonuclease McrA